MKIFLKWTMRSAIFLTCITFFTALSNDFDISRLPKVVLVVVIGILILALFFYLLEVKIIPWRIKKLNIKIKEIFNATILSETHTVFNYKAYDVYSEIVIALSLSQSGGREIIRFYVPVNQLGDVLDLKKQKVEIFSINDKQLYVVFQTNGLGLNFARKRLRKKINSFN